MHFNFSINKKLQTELTWSKQKLLGHCWREVGSLVEDVILEARGQENPILSSIVSHDTSIKMGGGRSTVNGYKEKKKEC